MYGYGMFLATNGIVQSNSYQYLINNFGASIVAYSLRKLSSSYNGSCIRVRRSSDNVEQDIAFTGNDLDTTSLLSFIGANSGHVVSWYDQSGNGRTITQATATSQPKIVNAGNLILATNGKAAIETDGDDFLNNTGFTNKPYDYTSTFVIDVPNLTTNYAIASASGNTNQYYISRTSGLNRLYDNKGAGFISAAKMAIGGHIVSIYETYKDATTTYGNAWEDGVQIGTNYDANITSGSGWYLFKRESGSGVPNGTKLQEFIQFDVALTSSITSLNNTLNDYYNIY